MKRFFFLLIFCFSSVYADDSIVPPERPLPQQGETSPNDDPIPPPNLKEPEPEPQITIKVPKGRKYTRPKRTQAVRRPVQFPVCRNGVCKPVVPNNCPGGVCKLPQKRVMVFYEPYGWIFADPRTLDPKRIKQTQE
jgi:hypothetical protein